MWTLGFILEPMISDILPHFVFSRSCLFAPPRWCCLLSSSASLPRRKIAAGVGRLGRKTCLLAVTSHKCFWPRPQGIPWPSSLCISDLQGLPLLPASFLQPGSSPSSLQALFFLGPLPFLGTPLFSTTFLSGIPSPWFAPSKYSKSLISF